MREFKFKIPEISEFILNHFLNCTILDIETTGLSKIKDNIFLIGKIEICKNPYLKIYFAENLEEEIEILKNLNIKGKKIITYNGDNFDIPFINKKLLNYNFDELNLPSFDLYKFVQKKNNILNLERKRQIDIEKFLNISRDEFVSGAKVANNYKKFLLSNDINSLDEIITHNRDDLLGLLASLNIINYVDEKSTFNLKGYFFKISDFYNLGNFLYIRGTTNCSENINSNFYEGKVIIRNYNFTITYELLEDNYDENRKCKYILKNKLPNLKSIDNIKSPELVHIIYLDNFLFYNVKELSKYLIEYFLEKLNIKNNEI